MTNERARKIVSDIQYEISNDMDTNAKQVITNIKDILLQTELEPCPLCGADAMMYEEENWWMVECVDCPLTLSDGKSKTDSIAMWNRRVTK